MSVNAFVLSKREFDDVLSRCWPTAERPRSEVSRHAPHVFDTLVNYEINTPLRIAHFLGQLGHESGRGRYTEELASGRAYEGRRDLGNTQRGDGVKFKGRGLIQLTGRANVTRYAQYKRMPELIDDPRPLAEQPLAADSAGWFWRFGTGSRVDLSRVADRDDLMTITRLINGGTNGLADRRELTNIAKAVIFAESARIVQATLNASRMTPELVVDGDYGPRTTSAVRDFQSQFFLKTTGLVDVKTWEKLSPFSETTA